MIENTTTPRDLPVVNLLRQVLESREKLNLSLGDGLDHHLKEIQAYKLSLEKTRGRKPEPATSRVSLFGDVEGNPCSPDASGAKPMLTVMVKNGHFNNLSRRKLIPILEELAKHLVSGKLDCWYRDPFTSYNLPFTSVVEPWGYGLDLVKEVVLRGNYIYDGVASYLSLMTRDEQVEVIRALNLSPDEVQQLSELSGAFVPNWLKPATLDDGMQFLTERGMMTLEAFDLICKSFRDASNHG